MCIAVNCSWSFVYSVIILCVSLLPHVYYFTIRVLLSHILLDARLLIRSQYPEGLVTGQLGTVFFLVSLCLKANAEMVPKTPSCYCMLLT